MADTTAPAAAPGATAVPGAGPGSQPAAVLRGLRRVAGIIPFTVYVALGLLIPTVAVAIKAFQNSATGSFTLSNVKAASTGIYFEGFKTDILLSIASAAIPGLIGFMVAYAIFTARRGSVLRRVSITLSGVFANFGGVPLAFLFIATLGSTGIVTGWLTDLGFNPYDHGFTLFTVLGVFLVYMYFQIPLMVLIILPALEGLRPAWREAAENMGARSWQYWRFVGIPVLLPSFLGCVLLLFGSSFSAYATAEAMTNGTIALTPIQIGTFLNGNVIAGQENVGNALALGMVVIIGIIMIAYTLLQRRAARWLR
jgi:putative spermidine/putrescine transport system permease protein